MAKTKHSNKGKQIMIVLDYHPKNKTNFHKPINIIHRLNKEVNDGEWTDLPYKRIPTNKCREKMREI